MKLGKTLNLSKCFYDKNHWTHPDLKEGQLYIIKRKDSPWLVGEFKHWTHPYADFWIFKPNYGATTIQLSSGKHPKEGWKHIQEVIV